MKNYVKLMRPHHWIKNALIFIPVFFDKSILDYEMFKITVAGFIVFCLASSFVYIINDIKDIEKDRMHSTKKNRPLANGSVNKGEAVCLAILLLILDIGIILLVDWKCRILVGLLFMAYIGINMFYSVYGKNIPVLDVFLLMSGFLIRILFGSVITGVAISEWLYLTAFSGSFFMGLGKRRNEIENEAKSRLVLSRYNYAFLDKMTYVCLTLALIFYSLWCFDSVNQELYPKLLIATIPLVIAIIFQYCLDIETSKDGDPVEVMIHDRALLILIHIFILLMGLMIYA